jgi:hypothetical protein
MKIRFTWSFSFAKKRDSKLVRWSVVKKGKTRYPSSSATRNRSDILRLNVFFYVIFIDIL